MDEASKDDHILSGVELGLLIIPAPFIVLFLALCVLCLHILVKRYGNLRQSFLISIHVIFAASLEYITSALPRIYGTTFQSMTLIECNIINIISMVSYGVISVGVMLSIAERYVSIKTDLSLHQKLFKKSNMKYLGLLLWSVPLFLSLVTLYPIAKRYYKGKLDNYQIDFCIFSRTQHVTFTLMNFILYGVLTSCFSLYIGYRIILHCLKHNARLRSQNLRMTSNDIAQEKQSLQKLRKMIFLLVAGIFLVNLPRFAYDIYIGFAKEDLDIQKKYITYISFAFIIPPIYEIIVITYYEKQLLEYIL